MMQLNMFREVTQASTLAFGLIVKLPDACSCGATQATVGSSAGPHHASLRCRACERHRGWMSGETYNFITRVIDNFGRPTEPISVRFKNSRVSADI